MRKAESSKTKDKDTPSFEEPRHRPHWLAAFVCLVFGVLLAVALLDYEPAQSVMFQVAGKTDVVNGTITQLPVPAGVSPNLVGVVGAEFSAGTYYLLGVSTWLIPVFLLWMAYIYLRSARSLAGTRILAMVCCVLSLSALAPMQGLFFTNTELFPEGPGGIIGRFIYLSILKDSIGVFGAALILGTIYFVGMLFIFTRDIAAEITRLMHNFTEWRQQRAALKAARAEDIRRQREEAAKAKQAAAAAATAAAPVINAGTTKKMVVPKGADPLADPAKPAAVPPTKPAEEPAPPVKPAAAKPAPRPVAEGRPATDPKALAVAAGKLELNIVKPEETKKAKVTLPQSDDKDYQFPPLKLLREQVKVESNSEEEHRQNAENLLRILGEFGVEVTLGEIHVGPVITRYEVVPAAGVRVEKISGLDKNIALGMRAQSVRILAPIPGKAAVGVEVPNQKSTPVGMREILESEDWVGAKAELPIALGKDVSGKPLVSDLSKMPHLLIAGATGSGKSVCINSIVASILYSKSPKDVRLIMVDPKVVELKIFNSLPHMLIPVVTEPKKVPGALKWLLSEMEQRYQIFAKANVRNLVGFNNRKKDPKAEFPPVEQQAELEGVADDIEIPDRLPYIVAIIDELADLMMIAPAEIETSIARLAQLARAAGIHLIIATQRPSVNVITGVIKANLPSRIAFQVASQVDSRTILDTKGADTLIGRGDMLFSPPGSSRLVRAQGAFVADEEVQEIVEFLKKNGPPQYAQAVQQQIDRAAREDDEDEEGEDDGDMGDDGDLFAQAYDVLKSTRRASTSMMQRRLRIGYNRAARIMDLMEQKGIVGPENGSSPREILVDLDTYQP
ncbi:DNA translocase SpoIIIE [Lacunisphaera limnophila]|uniref:DNA translocase SpoIIIE n=1 Tax=Lacunisphaera limnophila TaxID=1838286 RepID=A0A1D8AVZ0_9BACT|nr:DNA translocase FtsK [Lacunisphaera limnophila]AOS45057.1 DNA translocase SpoIIIE [Lacunisphaera limnophila]